MMKITGACHGGKVRFEAEGDERAVPACTWTDRCRHR